MRKRHGLSVELAPHACVMRFSAQTRIWGRGLPGRCSFGKGGAGNMVDLDSDPAKLMEVVEIGKQMLIPRGALTTPSIGNDVAKHFALLPAIFVAQHPGLTALNVIGLTSPGSAILSALIFNALTIVALVPLALRGVGYAPVGSAAVLRQSRPIYGLGSFLALNLASACEDARPASARFRPARQVHRAA